MGITARCGALAGSLAPLHPRKEGQAILRVAFVFPT